MALGSYVLVVDDEPAIRMIIREILFEEGYRVETAATGEEGLGLVFKEKPGLIVLDLHMPGKGGASMVHELREAPETRHIPVIVVSGSAESTHFPDMTLVQGYLVKPFDIYDLVAEVRNNLQP